MSKSKSICRAAFHHSEAVTANAVFGFGHSDSGTPEYSTGLRATERVSRELTTALGKQAARATVGVLG